MQEGGTEVYAFQETMEERAITIFKKNPKPWKYVCQIEYRTSG